MKLVAILALGILFSNLAADLAMAGVDDHIHSDGTKTFTPFMVANKPAGLMPGVFQQNVDHFGHAAGTFNQRYWVNSDFASTSENAPILLHICGEGDAEQGYFLNDNALVWAKELGAHVVYLEHRYYGKSLPFTDLSTDHLQFLTLDNVIEDLATFQKWIASTQGWTGKWISLGGSYSGTLSAIYRQKHPELVVGALAASAPMISGIGEMEGTQDEVSGLSSIDPSIDDGGRPWVYQSCTTFGFWQASGPYVGATLLTPSSWLCGQLFGNAPYANSTQYNQNYDLPFISNAAGAPSHIFFTYGSEDIWTTLGLSQQKNLNQGISIQIINGAGHHFDLNPPTDSDTAAVMSARAQFTALAKTWLN